MNKLLSALLLFIACLSSICHSEEGPVALVKTSQGVIRIQLDQANAPISVGNFINYAESGFYEGTVFHRTIAGFMIQGGGFTGELAQKATGDPIKNESSNGLSNARGTIAMARTSAPNSATAQFFINVVDNPYLDYQKGRSGYAVFGKVIEGMDVVDKIANTPTIRKGAFTDLPKDVIFIEAVEIESTQ